MKQPVVAVNAGPSGLDPDIVSIRPSSALLLSCRKLPFETAGYGMAWCVSNGGAKVYDAVVTGVSGRKHCDTAVASAVGTLFPLSSQALKALLSESWRSLDIDSMGIASCGCICRPTNSSAARVKIRGISVRRKC
jgi:hypothetical protein